MKAALLLKKTGKTIVSVAMGLLLFICGLVIVLYSPWAQNELLTALNRKFGVDADGNGMSIGSLRLKFPLELEAAGIAMVSGGDTAVRVSALTVSIDPLPLLIGNVSVRCAHLNNAFYRLGTPDSAMHMIIRADSLGLAPANVRLAEMHIDLTDGYISGGRLDMTMRPDTTQTPPAPPTDMRIFLRRIVLDDFAYTMRMMPTIDTLSAEIAAAELDNGVVDLLNQNITLELLRGQGLDATYITPDSAAIAAFGPVPVPAPADSAAAPWRIAIDSIAFDNSRALYAMADYRPLPGLDFSYIQLDDVSLRLHDFYNEATTVRLPLSISGRERCGVVLAVNGNLDIDSTALTFSDFSLGTPRGTHAAVRGMMGMGDMASEAVPLRLDLDGAFAPADLADIFPAAMPFLAAMPSENTIQTRVDAHGTSQNLEIAALDVKMNGMVTLSASGSVSSMMNPSEIGGDISLSGNIYNVNNLKNAVLEPATAHQLNIPHMRVDGHLAMNHGIAEGNIRAVTRRGDVRLRGRWNSRGESYDVHLAADTFPVDAFLPLMGLEAITATVDARGQGYNPFAASTTADAGLDVAYARYKGVDYHNIAGHATLSGGNAAVELNSDNSELDITVEASGNLNGDTYRWTATIDGRNIDLHALDFTPEPCNIEINADADATIGPGRNDLEARIMVNDMYYRRLSGTIALSDVDIRAHTSDTLSSVRIVNRDMLATLTSPASPEELTGHMGRLSAIVDSCMARMAVDVDRLCAALPPFALDVTAGSSNLVNDILSESGMSLRHLDLHAANDSSLALGAVVKGLDTGAVLLDSVYVDARQADNAIVLAAGMLNEPGNMDQWHRVDLGGRLHANTLKLDINQANAADKTGFDFGLDLSATPDTVLTLSLSPLDPTINYKQWSVNEGNYLRLDVPARHLDANLSIENGRSRLQLLTEHNDSDSTGHDHGQEDLIVNLSDIHLEDWIALNPFATPMRGDISASMRLNGSTGMIMGMGNARITNFVYGREPVADLKTDFNIAADRTGSVHAYADLFVNGIKTMQLSGALNDSTAASPMALDFSMIRFPLATVNPFLPEGTGRLSGMLNGTMDISGTPDRPVMNGYLDFDSTAVTVSMLGAEYRFSEDSIPVVDSKVSFDNFRIYGCNDNPLGINGTVNIASLSDIEMDLRLLAENMQLVNSRRASRGAEVYGKAFVDLDATVRGSMAFLNVEAKAKILPETNVTYVMQTSASEITNMSDSEMVRFVNFADTAAVAVTDSLQRPSMLMFVDARLGIEEGSIINVDLSPDGKYKAQILSNGNFTYSMTPMNTGRLTGRLNIDKGFVRYGVPPIVSDLNFDISSDSYVSFSGEMLNPNLNLHATDVVRANVLVDGQNSHLVNFNVTIAVTGTLERMDVAFDVSTIDDISIANELSAMSPEQRASQAMNLLLYKTYTGPGTKTDKTMTNSLYNFLAGQLNNWAANTIKGVDLSFGIDQYDKTVNGATSSSMTYSYQVSKSLFNDRFKIVVGGNYTTDANADENFSQNLINDISFEYFLNNARSMYIRLFRHTGYESILEGEITQTGVGFVYRRKLRRLGDMFLPPAVVRRREEAERDKTTQQQ